MVPQQSNQLLKTVFLPCKICNIFVSLFPLCKSHLMSALCVSDWQNKKMFYPRLNKNISCPNLYKGQQRPSMKRTSGCILFTSCLDNCN